MKKKEKRKNKKINYSNKKKSEINRGTPLYKKMVELRKKNS